MYSVHDDGGFLNLILIIKFQISALDTNAPIQDRLCQAFNLSLLATCKAMQNQYDESEDDNLVHLFTLLSRAG